jgi:hypothetical protein
MVVAVPRVLAQTSRYTDDTQSVGSFLLPIAIYRALRCDRCLVITFTAVTRVQIPSGTPNLINGLEEQRGFFAGTKRNSRTAKSLRSAVSQLHFPRFVAFFVGTKRHRLTPQSRVPLRGRETSESLHSALCVFVP